MLCTVKLGVAHVVQTSGATAGHVLLTPLAQGRALAARDSSLDAQHWSSGRTEFRAWDMD